MSRHKKKKPPTSPAATLAATPEANPSRWSAIWMWVVGISLLICAAGVSWGIARQGREDNAQRLIDEFVQLRGDKRVTRKPTGMADVARGVGRASSSPEDQKETDPLTLLAPAEDFPTEPVDDTECNRLISAYLLRSPLSIVQAIRSKTDRSTFTLLTRGQVRVPAIRRLDDSEGEEWRPLVVDPILTVEVKKGKIHAVNWDMPNDRITAFEAITNDEKILRQFAVLTNRGRTVGSRALLGPPPVFNDDPVSETEADARQAHYYLHNDPGIVSIRRGEPGPGNRWLNTPGRYTLVSFVQGSTPALRVRNVRGEVESPSKLFIINPDLVVEIREGKIQGIRAELHRD
jgi:hypothetical protein